MSKHPVGPWTETKDEIVPFLQPGYIADRANGTQTLGSNHGTLDVGSYLTRKGVNNGGPTQSPSSAELRLIEITHKPWSATATKPAWYNPGVSGPIAIRQKSGNTAAFAIPAEANVDISTAEVFDRAFNKLISKINSSPIQAAISAGEHGKTRESFARLVDALSGFHNGSYKSALKKINHGVGKRTSVKSVIEVLTDLHLEYNFGIKPLIHDMDGFLEALANTVAEKVHSTPVSVVEVKNVIGPYTHVTVNPSTSNYDTFNGDHTIRKDVKVIAKCGATFKSGVADTVPPWQEVFGVTLRDVLPTAVELLPYSWLVDYFSNAGSFVKLLSLHRGVVENGWKVVIYEARVLRQFTPKQSNYWGSPSTTPCSGSSGEYTYRVFNFNRDPFSVDSYVPSVHFELPNLAQAANVAALAANRLVRTPVPRNLFTPLQLQGIAKYYAGAVQSRKSSGDRPLFY